MEIHLLSIHVFKTGNRRYPIHNLLVRAEVDMNELQTMNEVLRVSSDYNCAIMSPGSVFLEFKHEIRRSQLQKYAWTRTVDL